MYDTIQSLLQASLYTPETSGLSILFSFNLTCSVQALDNLGVQRVLGLTSSVKKSDLIELKNILCIDEDDVIQQSPLTIPKALSVTVEQIRRGKEKVG